MEEIKQKIQELGKEIDEALEKLDLLKVHPNALGAVRNLAISFTCLEDARMRISKALIDLGDEFKQEIKQKVEAESISTEPGQTAQTLTPATPENQAVEQQPVNQVPSQEQVASPTTPEQVQSVQQPQAPVQPQVQEQTQPVQSVAPLPQSTTVTPQQPVV